MWRRLAVPLASLMLVLLVPAPASARQEVWLHDGAEMVWQSVLGWRQVIRFSTARSDNDGRDQAGGDVLFSGWRRGNRLVGHARTWREGCQWPFRYRVEGVLSDDGTRAVLRGPAPVIEACRVVARRAGGPEAVLVLVRLSEQAERRRRY